MAIQSLEQCPKCKKYYNAKDGAPCPFCRGEAVESVVRPLGGRPTPALANVISGGPRVGGYPPPAKPVVSGTPSGVPPTVSTPINITPPIISPIADTPIADTPKVDAPKSDIDEGFLCGFLVSSSGEDKGKYFRLFQAKNPIGRQEDGVSPSYAESAYIMYDDKKCVYWIMNGSGRYLVRVNEELLVAPIELKSGDELLIGERRMTFIPVCGEHFNWR